MAFRTGGTADYPIIDADTHVTEPSDLWTSRLPEKYLEQTPRVIDGLFGGKAWAAANGKQMAVSILVNTAGQNATDWELIPKDGYDRMRKGGWDPAERIKDMDIDMVDIHLIFPSSAFMVVDNPDREAYLANIRAYNDWMAEFCSYAPERLYGYAIMPISGVEDAIAEATRVRKQYDCLRSVVLRTWPNGSLIAKPSVDDPFWSAMEDLDMGVACHVGFDIRSGRALRPSPSPSSPTRSTSGPSSWGDWGSRPTTSSANSGSPRS
jgi:predicted TIM-barrel fold metal-dependent hydrolase